MILQKVKQYIVTNQLLNQADKLIVGVSGGADSIALLDILNTLEYECIVAHCNFHLRGEESNRDASFVNDFCKKKKLQFHSIDFDTESYAAEKSISIEMAARDLRYSWFDELRQEHKASNIVVAHHRDDSVETVLLNLIRGTGIRGLSGISAKNGYIVRPLLCLTRNEIIDYLNVKQIPFVTDSTNNEDIYTRNKIRLSVIPLLETINPSVKDAIDRTSEHLLQVENIYKRYIENAKKQILIDNKIEIKLLLKQEEPKAILFEILSAYQFSASTVAQVFKSLTGESGKVFYSENYRIAKDRDTLIITAIEKEVEEHIFLIEEKDTLLSYPLNLTIEKTLVDIDFKMEKSKNILYLDQSKIIFPLTIRKWQQGDWFIPFGMKGRKKISDYFSDQKFSLVDKENTWLLCSGDDIVWIVGHRSDERYKISDSTTSTIKICLNQ